MRAEKKMQPTTPDPAALTQPPEAQTRLLVICQGYPPYYGGAERAAAAIAEQAAASGEYAVSVLTSDIGGRLPAEEQRNGVAVYRIPCPKKTWTRHSVLELLAFYRAGRCHMGALEDRLHPEAIIAIFTMPAGLLGAEWARRYGTPYITVLQGSDVPGYQPGRFALLHPIMRVVARYVWRRAAHVSAVSGPLAELARQTLPTREFGVIPNGVDTRVFHPAPEGSSRGDNTIRLITVAQLIERKGIQHLIEAMAGMPAETRARLQADVYGSGPYETVLRERIEQAGLQDTMTLKGLADEEVLAPELRAADIFVLPTQQEGLPLALMEAMASGLPCLTTPVGDIPQVLQGELAELLVPPAQPEKLRAALETLIDAPERRRTLGAACRVAAEAYDWSIIWSRYAAYVSALREN